jgi:hypothetical protein
LTLPLSSSEKKPCQQAQHYYPKNAGLALHDVYFSDYSLKINYRYCLLPQI